MRRSLLILPLLLAAGVPVSFAMPSDPARDAARARVSECHPALARQDRHVVFVGTMHVLAQGEQMEMRFDLLARRPGQRSFHRVSAPASGLGVWGKADASVTRYRVYKRVENLPAPASYRALVRFRWRDGSGAVVAGTRRLTGICVEPDLRPELRVGGLSVTPGPGPASARYALVVRNDGASAATNFDVALAVDGLAQPPQTIVGLGPDARRIVVFTAPSCRPGGAISVSVDPDNRVAERNEANDLRTYPCPL